MLKVKKSFYRNTQFVILTLMFAGLLTFGSCSGDDTATGPDDEIEVEEVVIEPKNATFQVGEEFEFSAFLISTDGDTVNDEIEVEWNWYSSDPSVFTVEAGGAAYGQGEGEAFCIVEANSVSDKQKVKSAFVPIGLDSASVTLLN